MHQIVAFALTLALAYPALAIDMRFMKEAPITRLGADELKTFTAFVEKTLNEGGEDATVEWKATKATFTSKLTPQKRFKDGALECRDMRIESDSHDRSERGTYTFCKKAKGGWGIKSPTKR